MVSLGRYDEAVAVLKPHLDSVQFGEYQLANFLKHLLYSGREKESEEMMQTWLRDVIDAKPGKITPLQIKRAQGAIRRICDRHGYAQTIHPRWIPLLSETAIACAKEKEKVPLTSNILGQYRFNRTDGNRRVREAIGDWIIEQGADIDPAHCVLLLGYCNFEKEEWTKYRKTWIDLWRSENDQTKRRGLGDFIAAQSSHFFKGDSEALLAFQRERLRLCTDQDYLPLRRMAVFLQIMASHENWDEKANRELDDLLVQLEPLESQVSALQQLSDWIVRSTQHKMREDEEKGLEEMTIAERKSFARRIREGGMEAAAWEWSELLKTRKDDEAWSALIPWIELERIYFQAKLNDVDRNELLRDCLARLGTSPAGWIEIESELEQRRLARTLETALFLASDPDVDKTKLDGFIDKGIALDDPQVIESWRMQKWRLLTAREELESLERLLRDWAGAEFANPQWRRSLGYLLAESDRLQEAVSEFGILEKSGQLVAADAAALANWQQALGQKEASAEAGNTARNQAAEQSLSQAMRQIRQRVISRNSDATGQLEERDIEIMTELFLRCQRPEGYLYYLREIYRHTKDPRVPRCFVPGLMGRSAQEVYPALQRFFDLTKYIEEESSVDEMMTEIERIKKEKLVRHAVDHRALDLIEAELKRRASEVLNQPGQHIPLAVDALRRAMNRDFSEGERQLMAQWLRRYESTSSEELKKEIELSFQKLHEAEQEVFQRLEIGNQWAQWIMGHKENVRAADLLTAALQEARKERGGKFTSEMLNAASTLIQAYENDRHYLLAEKSLRGDLERSANTKSLRWLVNRLFSVYRNSVSNTGTTSFGSGEDQFRGARKWMLGELKKNLSGNDRSGLVSLFGDFHVQAFHKKIPSVGAELKQFAFEEFPPLIQHDRTQADDMVESIGHRLRTILGPVVGIEFVVSMLEGEPGWVAEETYEAIWYDSGDELMRWKHDHSGNLPENLSKRLLVQLERALMHQLEIQNFRNIYFCDVDSGWCWKEKLEEFCVVAENYIKRYPDSPSAIVNAARFFYDYPEKRNRACDLLIELHSVGKLYDDSGRDLLGGYLEHTRRWKDAERVNRELVGERPNRLLYHLRLARALFYLEKPAEMKRALARANDQVDLNGRSEGEVSELARLALEVKQLDDAIAWWGEAIRKHEFTRPDRGIGQGTVSEYYRQISEAHAELGQTEEAVHAASAAIVAWGPKKDQRTQAIHQLRNVIAKSENLEAFAKHLDEEVAESGLENPIVRKELGRVYLESKKLPAKAVEQFRLALEAQPDDGETHRLLVQALDKTGDEDAARDQLIESIRLAPRELSLLRDLAKRFEKAENASGAERARTGLVEAKPNEAEGHQELAKVRHQQKRWDEAIRHWDRVAELRELEPTGLIGKIETQLAANDRQAAEKTLAKLHGKKWPERFRSQVKEVSAKVKKSG